MKNRHSSMQEATVSEGRFAVHRRNVVWIGVGLLLMVTGYLLMMGGGTKDPNIFTGEQMFNFRRVVLAPIFVFAGFAFEIWAIMYKKKSE